MGGVAGRSSAEAANNAGLGDCDRQAATRRCKLEAGATAEKRESVETQTISAAESTACAR